MPASTPRHHSSLTSTTGHGTGTPRNTFSPSTPSAISTVASTSAHTAYSSPSARTRHNTTPSTSTNVTHHLHHHQAHQTKLNIVTRVAIEGKARQSGSQGKSDGAAVKMFLKLAIPLESVAPGATIPLFPEENVKILDSQVHPLDSNSAPYNFSSTTCMLLHRGARALNLPSRSRVLYTSLFGSASSTSSASLSSPPPLEERYVGHILVSGYHVSYVLPKEFPSRVDEVQSRTTSRRMSTGVVMQFMAAIDMWIPFLTKPPHSPYLLSIPTPRCLHNQIKLRIFSPASQSSISASLASLSSVEEELGSWDLTSEPHVTRSTLANNSTSASNTPSSGRHRSRSQTSQSYTHFADDESSDSSVASGFPDGYGMQGTFQSTERIRIRWARPLKPEDGIPETADGRKMVGVREVVGTTTCTVLGGEGDNDDDYSYLRPSSSSTPSQRWLDKGKGRVGTGAGNEGRDGSIVMKVECEATCKGIWFPGVATMLGLDVVLDTGDCNVDWAPDGERKWVVNGAGGFMGFAIPGPPTSLPPRQFPTPLSRQSSDASDGSPFVHPSDNDGTRGNTSHATNNASLTTNGHSTSYYRSATSASLLRVPLPSGENVPDYSFEASPNITPTSSIASLATIPSSPERGRKSRGATASSSEGFYPTDGETDESELLLKPPNLPIAIHINTNELVPPAKNVLTFTVSGTIIVTPPTSDSSGPTSARLDFERYPHHHYRSTNSNKANTSSHEDKNPIALPRFRLFHIDQTSSSSSLSPTFLRSQLTNASIDVYNATGDLNDAQSRKTVVQPGGQARCGNEGARIAIRSIPAPTLPSSPVVGTTTFPMYDKRVPRDAFDDSSVPFGKVVNNAPSPVTPRTPAISEPTPSVSPSAEKSVSLRRTSMYNVNGVFMKPPRDGPLMIPSIDMTITPLLSSSTSSGGSGSGIAGDYAVKICLPAPSDADSEWLEFGLAVPFDPTSTSDKLGNTNGEPRKGRRQRPPAVQVASASLEGVPVHFETTATVKPEKRTKLEESVDDDGDDAKRSDTTLLPFGETSGKEWVTWVKVHVGEGGGGGSVEVVYLVRGSPSSSSLSSEDGKKGSEGREERKGSGWNGLGWKVRGGGDGGAVLNVLLPTFSLPVGRLEVHVEALAGFDIRSVLSNLTHESASTSGGRRFLHYSMDEFFYPRLVMTFHPSTPPRSSSLLWKIPLLLFVTVSLALLANSSVLGPKLLPHTEKFLMSRPTSTPRATPHVETSTKVVVESVTTTSTMFSIVTATVTETSTTTITSVQLRSETKLTRAAASSARSSPSPSPPSSLPTAISNTPPSSSPSSSSSSPPTDSPLTDSLPLWPSHIDFPTLKSLLSSLNSTSSLFPSFDFAGEDGERIPEAFRVALAGMYTGAGWVWGLARRVIHYPLDPP